METVFLDQNIHRILCRFEKQLKCLPFKFKNYKIVESSLEALINSDTPVLLDFHASWCGPCRAMVPVLDALETDFEGRLRILKIDVDDHTDLAVRMKVMGVPTFMLYQEGKELWRQPGVFTKEALTKVIEAAVL